MTQFIRLSTAVVLFALLASPVTGDEAESHVRVMSFNIRYGTANDGDDHWNNRRQFIADTIKTFNPDLLGTQETLGFQRDFLAEQLPEYGVFGVGRDDGKEQGEMMAIYYRKDRFEKLDGGHFWYSETPDVPGTKAWDSSLPRMASWLKLKDRRLGKTIFIFNTHFDHRGQKAREESATMLREKVFEIAESAPGIVTGDFNAAPGGTVYGNLFEIQNEAMDLVDTYRQTHSGEPEVGTAGGFRRSTRGTNRIDWIACTRGLRVLEADIDRTHRDGRTPSDHDPVTAVFAFDNE